MELTNLIANIQTAFKKRPRPSKQEILSRSGGSSSEIKVFLENRWHDLINSKYMSRLTDFPLLADEDIAYFLPAILINILSCERQEAAMLEEMVVSFLTQSIQPGPVPISDLFNAAEQSVIHSFLLSVIERNQGQEFPISVPEETMNMFLASTTPSSPMEATKIKA